MNESWMKKKKWMKKWIINLGQNFNVFNVWTSLSTWVWAK